MTRKLLICPWFGPFPPWIREYMSQSLERGYEFNFITDREWFQRRLVHTTGVVVPLVDGGTKMHDTRPVLGHAFRESIAERGIDWWGHTDFDCVYGRLNEFASEEKLAECDIYTDCAYDYLSGPFTLYRTGVTERLFFDVPGWKEMLADPDTNGWVEKEFSVFCQHSVRVTVENNHAYTEPRKLRREDGRLMHGDREISFFHFRRTKEWPL